MKKVRDVKHTAGHVRCPACEEKKMSLTSKTPLAAELFKSGADRWLKAHARERDLKPRSVQTYEEYIEALEPFFGSLKLQDIHIGHIREYQEWRSEKAGNRRINAELSCLHQILREARLWGTEMQEFYKPLKTRREGAGRSLSPEDMERMIRIAFTRPHWHLAGHCMNIMFKCGFGFGELRHVRRSDVDLAARTIAIVKGAKNDPRVRLLAMLDDVSTSVEWILDRWQSLGGSEPEQYILPHRARRRGMPTDFTQPMGSIKKAFGHVRKAAGIPKFRVYDCRVTSLTHTLDSGVPLMMSERIHGHISKQMQDWYYKPGLDTLREAMEHVDAHRKRKAPKPVASQPLANQPLDGKVLKML
jgi:integrase